MSGSHKAKPRLNQNKIVKPKGKTVLPSLTLTDHERLETSLPVSLLNPLEKENDGNLKKFTQGFSL